MPTSATASTSTRDTILQAAATLFGSLGYHGTGMRQLADAVGIEPASVYSHYRGKDDILYALAMQCADDFLHTLTPIYDSELNTRSKLQAMITAHVQVLVRNLEAAPVFNTEWRHLEPERRLHYARLRDQYEAMFRDVIRQGVQQHLLREMDEKLGALTLLSALNFVPQWYRPDGELNPTELGELMAATLMNGLLKRF